MSEDIVLTEITGVIDQVRTQKDLIEEEFMRVKILTTGTLRLLAQENAPTLKTLRGEPEQLKAHLIQSLTLLGNKVASSLGDIEASLLAVLEEIRKP